MFANGGTKRPYRDLCYLSAFWRKRHRSAIVRHSRVLFQTERAAIGKADPERRIAAGLDHVALEHEIADVQVDGDAVARDRRGPAHRFDAPDRLLRGRRGRLSILTRRGRAGKKLDQTRGDPLRLNSVVNSRRASGIVTTAVSACTETATLSPASSNSPGGYAQRCRCSASSSHWCASSS
jgi:hypothetical protein